MTARGFYTLLFGLLFMVTALSVGSGSVFLLGAVALAALAVSGVCVLCALLTCRIDQDIPGGQAERGSACIYRLRMRLFTPLPIGPLALRVAMPSGKESDFLLAPHMFATESENTFTCPHVGVFGVGLISVSFTDCFGLFALRHRVRQPLSTLTVLPVPAESAPLKYSPGEGESTMTQRALADLTTPADTRAWQEGDELKRVHWKLSMRRQSLMVHTYETPQRPDALVILDCAQVEAPENRRAHVADVMLETCAGILKRLLEDKRPTRLPLTGDQPTELSGQGPEHLAPMLTALASEPLTSSADFSRVLLLASRRMQRTGSTAIITSRLTPAVADAAIMLGRMGPHIRFILVCAGEPDATQTQLLGLLCSSGIEAAHVAC